MARPQVAALIVPSQIDPGADKPAGAVNPLAAIAGKSIPGWIVDAALGASIRRVALIADDVSARTRAELVGRADDAMIEFVRPVADVADTLSFAIERLGSELTLRDGAHVVVVPAECPQIESTALRRLVDEHMSSGAAATICMSEVLDPLTEPLITRDSEGRVSSISDVPLGGVNLMCIKASLLAPALRRVTSPSWERGAPLGDIAAVLSDTGHTVHRVDLDPSLIAIRSMTSRAVVEQLLRDRIIHRWLSLGVDIPLTGQIAVDATVSLGQGVRLLPGAVLEGATVVAEGACIGPNTHLIDATIGCNAHVPSSVIDGAEVAAHTAIKPFTVLSGRTDHR